MEEINQIIYTSLESIVNDNDIRNAGTLLQVEKLLKNDLCSLATTAKNDIITKVCEDDIGKMYYQQGISGIISSLQKFLTQFYESSEQSSLVYFQSTDHLYLQWLSLPFINEAFNMIIENTIQLIQEYIDLMMVNLTIIWYLFGLSSLVI